MVEVPVGVDAVAAPALGPAGFADAAVLEPHNADNVAAGHWSRQLLQQLQQQPVADVVHAGNVGSC